MIKSREEYYLQKNGHESPISNEAVKEAITELRAKSLKQIQTETAIKWSARYLAALSLNLDKGILEEYKHEAIEHAALVGSIFLTLIVKQIGEAND